MVVSGFIDEERGHEPGMQLQKMEKARKQSLPLSVALQTP